MSSDASLQGRLVELRGVVGDDISWVQDLLADPRTASRWRLGGVLSVSSADVDRLNRDSLATLIVWHRSTGQRVGLVQAFNQDFLNGVVYGGIVSAGSPPIGTASEALLLFIEYLFNNWRFRKIYFTTPADVLPDVKGGSRWVNHEGILRDREYRRGAFVDIHITSMSRETWSRLKERRRVWPTDHRPARRTDSADPVEPTADAQVSAEVREKRS